MKIFFHVCSSKKTTRLDNFCGRIGMGAKLWIIVWCLRINWDLFLSFFKKFFWALNCYKIMYRQSGWLCTRWGEIAQSLNFKCLYKSHCKYSRFSWSDLRSNKIVNKNQDRGWMRDGPRCPKQLSLKSDLMLPWTKLSKVCVLERRLTSRLVLINISWSNVVYVFRSS